jgi:hypothetical protein
MNLLLVAMGSVMQSAKSQEMTKVSDHPDHTVQCARPQQVVVVIVVVAVTLSCEVLQLCRSCTVIQQHQCLHSVTNDLTISQEPANAYSTPRSILLVPAVAVRGRLVQIASGQHFSQVLGLETKSSCMQTAR